MGFLWFPKNFFLLGGNFGRNGNPVADHSSNSLELRAILLSLHHFTPV